MKSFALLVTLFFFLQSVIAGGEGAVYPAFGIPKGSNITLKEVKEIPPFLYFEGEIRVKAKYIYDRRSDSYIELTILPDEKSSRKLPYLKRRGEQERPSRILILESNVDTDQLLSHRQIHEIKAGTQSSFTGEAEMVIYDIGGGFECDKPAFLAKLRYVVSQSQMATINIQEIQHDC